MNEVSLAIVGTGQRGWSYVEHLRRTPGARLAWLCDTNEARLRDFARQLNVTDARLTTQLSDALADPQLAAVIITTPDRTHKEMALRCFAAGKHVMLEKPMALTVGDCKAIMRACRDSGCMLQMGFVLRCTDFYMKIKELIDCGRLGQIMSISASELLGFSHSASYMRRWHRRSANSGSFMLAKCSHDIDILNWLTGSLPTHVASFGECNFFLPAKQPATHCSRCPQAAGCPFKFDGGFVFMTQQDRDDPSANDFDLCVYNPDKDIADNQVTILQYASGARASFSLQLLHPPGTQRFITIAGTKGYLSGSLEENRIRLQHSGGVEEFDVTPKDAAGHSGGDIRFTQEFVQSLLTGRAPQDNLGAGLASTAVGVAIEKARRTMQVVAIDPADYQEA